MRNFVYRIRFPLVRSLTGDGTESRLLFQFKSRDKCTSFQANSDEDIQQARALFEEYASGIGISLCFQNFDHELKNLPGDYAPPDGRLLLATEDDQLAGCIALRKLAPDVCEMKRLFVRPAYRGKRLGKILVESIIDEARKLGYTHMRLDTIPGRDGQSNRTLPIDRFRRNRCLL